MHAVVRFLIDEAKKLHVVPVDDIADFFPNNEFDFDKKFVYSVYWHDPVEDANTGLYDAQVLMLGGKLHDHKPLFKLIRMMFTCALFILQTPKKILSGGC
ncbi:hypothetical protein HPB48_019829 [Haemaphysalis longicornis]|uniref:Uncharacterized protein n=1 Tax=Haemaphysalis longicornis TaxID=44386 RepID=A0A9J6FBA7_HAELO|nr:hypothetical protein HPB48_019829 [Haemaphysalis longicornis]